MVSCREDGKGRSSSCGNALGALMMDWMKLGSRVDGEG